MALPTIVAQRSPLYWIKVPGGLPVILDTSKVTGNIFFVMAGGTDTAGYGYHPDKPFATIDFAIGQCTANQGDHIFVMPGHAETITAAAGIDADVAGISIIGLGQGESRPIITFGTAVAADLDIDAANIKIKNILFKCDIDSQTAMIDVNAKDFLMEDCELREGSAKQALTYIDLNGGAANAVDRATLRRIKIVSYTAGADKGIGLEEVADEVTIEDCVIDGDFTNAGIHNPTGKILTNLRLLRNVVRNRQTTDHAIELVSACTGEAVGNSLFADTAASVFDPGSLFCAGNRQATAIDQESADIIALWPAAAAAGNGASLAAVLRYIEDALVGSAGVVTFPSAAAPADAVNLAEVLRSIWAATQGTAASENGIVTWPAAAAYANNVSLAEVLAYIQDGVRKGTGTGLGTNESLADVLYAANGIVTFPAAAVPGNGVSIAEVLRDIWDAVRNGTGGSEPGTNKSLVDAIGFDGAAAVTATAGMLRVMAGTTFVMKKTLTSSAVVQAGVDVTAVSTGGDIAIEDWYLQTDGTGLAAGTNFTMETNNAKGTAVFCSHAVGSLGTQAVIDKKAATTGKGVVLESGKKVVAKCTVADCTGTGTIDVYLICRRLADNAALAAA